jgi:hypothetical protein
MFYLFIVIKFNYQVILELVIDEVLAYFVPAAAVIRLIQVNIFGWCSYKLFWVLIINY